MSLVQQFENKRICSIPSKLLPEAIRAQLNLRKEVMLITVSLHPSADETHESDVREFAALDQKTMERALGIPEGSIVKLNLLGNKLYITLDKTVRIMAEWDDFGTELDQNFQLRLAPTLLQALFPITFSR